MVLDGVRRFHASQSELLDPETGHAWITTQVNADYGPQWGSTRGISSVSVGGRVRISDYVIEPIAPLPPCRTWDRFSNEGEEGRAHADKAISADPNLAATHGWP